MATEKAEVEALKKECDGLRTKIEVRSPLPAVEASLPVVQRHSNSRETLSDRLKV